MAFCSGDNRGMPRHTYSVSRNTIPNLGMHDYKRDCVRVESINLPPPLPFPSSALEPYISTESVRVHYMFHQTEASRQLLEAVQIAVDMGQQQLLQLKGMLLLEYFIKRAPLNSREFRNASQVWSHIFYWHGIKPLITPACCQHLLEHQNGDHDNLHRRISSKVSVLKNENHNHYRIDQPPPTGPIAQLIMKTFGSLQRLQQIWAQTADSILQHGSGWIWLLLVQQPTKKIAQRGASSLPVHYLSKLSSSEASLPRNADDIYGRSSVKQEGNHSLALHVFHTFDADHPIRQGIGKPLLVCDLWEHAYVLDYQWNVQKYLESWWKLVNWEFVNENVYKDIFRAELATASGVSPRL